MGISPLTITGVSSFSDDFQTILSRAVSIASIPVNSLQNEQVNVLTRKQLLTDLATSVTGLASAIGELGRLGANKALSASSSNSNRVSVTYDGATTAAVYTISDITSVAMAASERTASGYASAGADAVDADGELQLVLGSTSTTITLAESENNLNGLRDAINDLGIGVTATILNTGSGETPYYLSLTAAATGATTLALRTVVDDDGSNILTSDNQGANAVFKLNGLEMSRADNIVTGAIDGLNFTIVNETDEGETVSLTLASSRAGMANALSNLATAYNTLRGKLNAQVGEAAGLLSGDFIVRHLQGKLRELTAHEGEGSIARLADLGIQLSAEGEMSFDSTRFYALSSGQLSAAFDFLGSTTTGLGAYSEVFDGISDPVAGMIKVQQDRYDDADERITTQIDELNERIDYMQRGLALQLQQADAMLASLEAQQNILTASLEAANLALFGKNED